MPKITLPRSARVYLASPYSHPCQGIMQKRFVRACQAAADLMEQGCIVYSPIAHGHVVAKAGVLPVEWPFWERQCMSFLENWATVLAVLKLPGWESSRGVAAEMQAARRLGLKIIMIEPAGAEGQ